MEQALCSGCGKSIGGSEILYTADARVVCAACNERAEAAVATVRPPWLALAAAGAVAGTIPLFVHVSSSSSSTINGHVTAFVYRDWVAIVCGVTAALLGVTTAWVGRHGLQRAQAIVAGVALVGFGGYQIANGLGVFAAPSDVDSMHSLEMTTTSLPSTPPPPVTAAPEPCADAATCFDLARTAELAKDIDRALAIYTRACDFKSDGGCFNAGILNKIDKSDFTAAVPFFQKSCDLGDLAACNEVGLAYRKGRGAPIDLPRALRVLTAACDGGGGLACLNLATMYRDGQATAVDPAAAFKLYVKACELDPSDSDLAMACSRTGEQLVSGTGVKKDLAEAKRYFEMACRRAPQECFDLGDLIDDKDPKTARDLYRKSCDAGAPEACNNLGHLEQAGLGGPKDKADAQVLFKKACDGGVQVGCENLAKPK